jgi:hypothetical protein
MNAMNQITPEGKSKAEVVIDLMSLLLKYRVDIEAALGYADHSHTFDNIVDMVVTGAAHFYPLENSFVLMEVLTYPQHKNYHVFLAGGTKEEILDVHPWMLENARKLNCKYVTVCGRLGWVRELKRHGWEYKFATLSKEVP